MIYRVVNGKVQDRLAEVPNPDTLLTNVPPNVKSFSVIYLSSAFVSGP